MVHRSKQSAIRNRRKKKFNLSNNDAIIKVRCSIEPKDRIYVKGYGFLFFAKNMGKNLSNKYSQRLLDSAKTSTTDAIETASKKAIEKAAEVTGDLIGNKFLIK